MVFIDEKIKEEYEQFCKQADEFIKQIKKSYEKELKDGKDFKGMHEV